ncbi:MAG: amidohydrolase family protein, partial [Nitrosopumilaceae archaeon]|nr:amidohydrolase family protein [Nitrosopumilaceae archaeon]NIU85790.1 amidohydrolase family protein [Nitrosopumilaceae archaeon]NIV64647.1 amidohydrolase family protein [Nitrosopumilaceae archaeon]NIX60036.1 amidohydrolase family protein [Nitrosopumilaceae archaeon]
MNNSCRTMIKRGITTFVDFREGGIDGIYLLKKALHNLPIRSIILGRVDYYQNTNQIQKNERFPKGRHQELS